MDLSVLHSSCKRLLSNKPNDRVEHPDQLLPGIIVLNAKYFPDTSNSPSKVGATAFAMSAVQILKDAGLLCGVILYQRLQGLQQPTVANSVRDSVNCTTISFNFEMDASLLRAELIATSKVLASKYCRLPMLYYQTDTLLEYHPNHLPFCVTHHGPFCEDVTHHFSEDLAGVAFGGIDKAQHLRKHQYLGIQHLKSRSNAFVFQHSQLQGKYLLKSGIDSSKIFRLCPPIHSMRIHRYPEVVDEELQRAVNSPGIFLFTAVARLDYFKNIELLVDTAVQLLSHNELITVLIAGDDEKDNTRRISLMRRIPASYRTQFLIIPKLPKDTLYWLFRNARRNGIFVCPSRYETLGITPLEAGLSGVTTVISNSIQVEAKRFFPKKYRFVPTATHLAALIRWFQKSSLDQCGCELRRLLQESIPDRGFELDFLNAWRECSRRLGHSIAAGNAGLREG